MGSALGLPFPWTKPIRPGVPEGYRALRDGAPISLVRLASGEKVWVAASHATVCAILRDPRFSSEHSHPGFPGIFPLPQRRDAQGKAPKLSYSGMDGAEHRYHRAMVADLLTASRMSALEPQIRSIADRAISAMRAGPRPANLVAGYAEPVASGTVCELLGIPAGDQAEFQRLSATILGGHPADKEKVVASSAELKARLSALLHEKRRTGADDLLGALIVRYDSAGRYDHEQLVHFAAAFTTAGHETAVAMIALGAAVLIDSGFFSAGDAARLRLRPAIEELLRYLSVADLVTARVAIEDIDLEGVRIAAGEGVIALGAGANHDPLRFREPGAFNPGRKAAGHVAFGHGAHKCLGQHLARIQLRVAFEVLFDRMPDIALATPLGAMRTAPGGVIHTVRELPVTWK